MTKRLLPIVNGNNFRDLGGYQTTDGHTIKWRKLIRSGHLNSLSQSDIDYLDKMNVKYDVDFRAPEEVTKQPDRVPGTAKYEGLPVFDTDRTEASHKSFEDKLANEMEHAQAGHDHMVSIYKNMVTTDQAKQSYRSFFDSLLANDDEGSVLFHCTAGKDRTGMGAVFLLNALNVDHETIIKDYLLTNQVSKRFVEQKINEAKQSGVTNQNLLNNIYDLSTVSPDYVNGALKVVHAEFGDMHNFLREHIGVSDDEMHDLRKMYLD